MTSNPLHEGLQPAKTTKASNQQLKPAKMAHLKRVYDLVHERRDFGVAGDLSEEREHGHVLAAGLLWRGRQTRPVQPAYEQLAAVEKVPSTRQCHHTHLHIPTATCRIIGLHTCTHQLHLYSLHARSLPFQRTGNSGAIRLRGTAAERRSLAGELSLSCTRPVADG